MAGPPIRDPGPLHRSGDEGRAVRGQSDREADRGKVSLGLRRKFIELAAQPALRRDNLLVYCDDADKASGNGWFDGVYNGGAVQYNRKYQAALSLDRGPPLGAGGDHRRPGRRTTAWASWT